MLSSQQNCYLVQGSGAQWQTLKHLRDLYEEMNEIWKKGAKIEYRQDVKLTKII
jgi:hypothetical protein